MCELSDLSPPGSLHQRSSLKGLEYQVGYINLLQCGTFYWDRRKLHFSQRDKKGRSFRILVNDYIKVYKEDSIYSHDIVNEDFG